MQEKERKNEKQPEIERLFGNSRHHFIHINWMG